jgi:tetratricopeptide (TPR) repeat protein
MIEVLLEAERALSMGMLDQAERLYWQAVESDRRNVIAIVGLARVALERGDDRTALEFARKGLELDPENGAAARLVERVEGLATLRAASAGSDAPIVPPQPIERPAPIAEPAPPAHATEWPAADIQPATAPIEPPPPASAGSVPPPVSEPVPSDAAPPPPAHEPAPAPEAVSAPSSEAVPPPPSDTVPGRRPGIFDRFRRDR